MYGTIEMPRGYHPEYRKEIQGKCIKCRIRWIWRRGGIAKLKNAHCPICGDKLLRTSYRLKWPVKRTSYVHIGTYKTG